MGESFFHGLTQIILKKTQVRDLEVENARLKSFEAAIRQEFEDFKKKSSNEVRQVKNDLVRLQYELDTLKLDMLKKKIEHSSELAKIQAKHNKAEANHRKELSEAYLTRFLA